MKTNLIIAVIAIVFILLLGALVAFILTRFINTPTAFIANAEIVRFIPTPKNLASGVAEEYHLWLKIEIPRPAFDRIFGNDNYAYSKDAPIKKDAMKTERLATESAIQNMLIIKGFVTEGKITDTGAALRISKSVILSKENLKTLDDNESLCNPQVAPHNQFRPQTDIYQTTEGDKILLYTHLESGIKHRAAGNRLSLTITYLRDNRAILSQTLPLFSY